MIPSDFKAPFIPVAHELGHLTLHRGIFEKLRIDTIQGWIEFIDGVPEEEYRWIEMQAYEFAGRFLVPCATLKERFHEALRLAQKAGFASWDASGDAAKEYIAQWICGTFGVSGRVIEHRLSREGLWPPNA